MTGHEFGIRWTIGDVSPKGFEALRLSIRGAARAFGRDAALAVVVNSLPVEEARRRTGSLPGRVVWLQATPAPGFMTPFLDRQMVEGVARATEWVVENWRKQRPVLCERIGLTEDA